MESSTATSFDKPKSPLETNNKTDTKIYKPIFSSVKGNKNFSRPSGNSLMPYKSGRNQVCSKKSA